MACMLFTASVLTSCNDDDVIIDRTPDQFKMELTSLNIAWDETEGFVQFDANENWRVESTSAWITVDPSKGDAGTYRTYFIFEPNPYRLPRTGDVNVTCGEEKAVVHVIQAGCTDDSRIAPVSADLEIPSFDYETGEIPFSTFSESIMGNLGLTMAEFGEGVDDDGDLQFFMVAKDGSWYQGGTSGTRCGAWLDGNYNVVPWDGAGYPAIAAFIEVYGGEDPVLVIGRAPGVPDNTEYTFNFGFASSDMTKYQLFSINVVFPAADLKGNVVATFDLSYQAEPNDEYIPGACEFNAQEVASLLGASSISLAKVVSYDAAGEFVAYTANNGYWYAKNGQIGSWGESAGWFIEYYGNDAESTEEDLNTWWIGNMPGCDAASATSKIGFWYNGNVVMFNIHVTIGEGGSEPENPDTPGDEPGEDGKISVVTSHNIAVTHEASKGYDATFIEFDANEVLSLLGCLSLDDLEIISLNSEGEVEDQTDNNGYWYNLDGEVCTWGSENFAWYIEYWGEDEETPGNVFSFGSNPEVTSADGSCNVGFAFNGKAVMYNVQVTIAE